MNVNLVQLIVQSIVDCDSMSTWTYAGSGKSGLYDNDYHHRDNCNYCTLELEEERQTKMREKKVAIQQHFQL